LLTTEVMVHIRQRDGFENLHQEEWI